MNMEHERAMRLDVQGIGAAGNGRDEECEGVSGMDVGGHGR